MRELLQQTLDLWRECPSSPPQLDRSFQEDGQRTKEAHLERFLAAVQVEEDHLPRIRDERQAARDRILAAFETFARDALDFEAPHLEVLMRGGFSSVGTNLARFARRFDPAVSIADILQANRNALTACGLQGLLGRAMELTPAIFAYSMLYPYSDNYLDDPATPREAKQGFNARFGRRLGGDSVEPENGHEKSIWRLVGLIEQQYSRAEWPQVFTSLLDIHRAQVRSLQLQRNGSAAGEDEILEMTFQKGGTSVLADGYLAMGQLTPEAAQSIFDWGVLLQLADDLQDVLSDRGDGAVTMFTRTAGRGPLDGLTNRTFHFAQRVMHRIYRLPGTNCRPLKDLMMRSCFSLLIRSAGQAEELYSREFLNALETHSPFRFSYLNERRKRLGQQGGMFGKLFEAFLEGGEDEPPCPILPSSLMPRA